MLRPAVRRARRSLLLSLVIGLVLLLLAWPVQAHGRELDIQVASLAPDGGRPLLRLYRAEVRYAADGEPVEGAQVVLKAQRLEDRQGAGPVRLSGLAARPGLYLGELEYPRFGDWQVDLQVEAALAQGEGRVAFTDRVRPGDAVRPSPGAEQERLVQLRLLYRVGWWPDGLHLLVRVTHGLAGLGYFAALGLVGLIAWLGPPARYPGLPAWLARRFPGIALASLALILLTGLYNAAFGSPAPPPGLLAPARVAALPYGAVYLAVLGAKMLGFLGLAWLALATSRAMRTGWLAAGPAAASAEARLRRLTLLVVGQAVLFVLLISLSTYLHYTSHLGLLLSPR